MKYKTKQEEINWLRAELVRYRVELKECNELIAELRKRAEFDRALDNIVHNRLWPITSKHEGQVEYGELLEALVKNHEAYLKLIGEIRFSAERKVRDVERLVSSIKFIATCTCTTSGSTYVGTGNALSITVDEVLRKICEQIESLVASERGVVNSNQERRFIDHVAKCFQTNSDNGK